MWYMSQPPRRGGSRQACRCRTGLSSTRTTRARCPGRRWRGLVLGAEAAAVARGTQGWQPHLFSAIIGGVPICHGVGAKSDQIAPALARAVRS